MSEPARCPRKLPDTGDRCDTLLPAGARYGPCPTCRADIARRHDEALYWRCARVGQALADGYEITETNEFALPAVEITDEVIASDRAGAPTRRR